MGGLHVSPAPGPQGAVATWLSPLPPLQIYPDESHYFSSAALQQHLYRSILGFFVECFRIQDKLPAVTAREEEEED